MKTNEERTNEERVDAELARLRSFTGRDFGSVRHHEPERVSMAIADFALLIDGIERLSQVCASLSLGRHRGR